MADVKSYPVLGVSLLSLGLSVFVDSVGGDTEDGRLDFCWSWSAIIWSGGGVIWSTKKNA